MFAWAVLSAQRERLDLTFSLPDYKLDFRCTNHICCIIKEEQTIVFHVKLCKMGLHWSLAVILVGYIVGELLRIILKRTLPKEQYTYAKEIISTFQLSFCVFEISVVGRFYSVWVGLGCSFVLLALKNAELIFEGALANPCAILEDVVYKEAYFVKNNVAKIACQVIGGLLSFPFIQLLWQSSWSELHDQQVRRGLRSTLEVSLLYGFFIEIFGTFVTTMSDFASRGKALRKFNAVIRAACIVVVCYLLSETTGVWMNPALATAQTFVFCSRKEGIYEHLIVFWVGPTIGTLAAIQMNTLMFRSLPAQTKGKKKSKRTYGKQSSEKKYKDEGINPAKELKKRHTGNA